MYVCMNVCMYYVNMILEQQICMYVLKTLFKYVCMVLKTLFKYVCMGVFACMYVCMYTYTVQYMHIRR